jgi:hypothetical protein
MQGDDFLEALMCGGKAMLCEEVQDVVEELRAVVVGHVRSSR